MRIISPSLLSADFRNIKNVISIIENAGAKRLHLDVMDGHFVPALTFGPMIIESIRKSTDCHLETHLMIEKPHESLDQYINAGSDTIIIHLEASTNPIKDLKYIKNNNVHAGIAINPNTEVNLLSSLIDYLDYILIMSVYPGRGGQAFIPDTLEKINSINVMRMDKNIIIGVDGGVNINTISTVFKNNIDVAIVGSGLFKTKDLNQRYQELMNA